MTALGVSGGRPWRRLGHGLCLLALVLVVGAFVAASVPALVGADHAYVVQSDSMSPAIEAGDVVFVSAVPATSVSAGDVVTFEASGGAGTSRVTHRVVDVVQRDGEPRFRTQGDANDAPDGSLVAPSALTGRVSFHLPLIGYGIAVAGTNLGLVAFVVVPAVLLLVLELWDLATADEPSGDGA